MTPYQIALKKNRDEVSSQVQGVEQMIGVREMRIQADSAEIVVLMKSAGSLRQLIIQIDMELNSKSAAIEPSDNRVRDILAGEDA